MTTRRDFLKGLGKLAAGGAVAIALTNRDLPDIGQAGAIPPPQRQSPFSPIGNSNFYQIHHDFTQMLSERYKCECGIYKSVNPPYNVNLYLNGHISYLPPHFNGPNLDEDGKKYFESHFEVLAIRARKPRLVLLKHREKSTIHLATDDDKPVCKPNASLGDVVRWEQVELPKKDVCPKCIHLAKEAGIVHKDIVKKRRSLGV